MNQNIKERAISIVQFHLLGKLDHAQVHRIAPIVTELAIDFSNEKITITKGIQILNEILEQDWSLTPTKNAYIRQAFILLTLGTEIYKEEHQS